MTDHIVATPFAPIIMYADVKKRQAVFYDLRDHVESEPINLPVTPRHVVLDTTGAKIAITDDIGGGFVLLHAYKKSIEFVLEDFPPTGDVLFDPNDVDIYFSNQASGSLGMLDINTQRIFEMSLTDDTGEILLNPDLFLQVDIFSFEALFHLLDFAVRPAQFQLDFFAFANVFEHDHGAQ